MDTRLELVGTSDGSAYYIPPRNLQRFMDSEPAALDLIRQVAVSFRPWIYVRMQVMPRLCPTNSRMRNSRSLQDLCTLSSVPSIRGAQLDSFGIRRLTISANYRLVQPRQPVFREGELGNSLAVVVDGLLQPTCHGAIAAPLASSAAATRWKALSAATKLMSLSKISGGATKVKGLPSHATQPRLPPRTPLRGKEETPEANGPAAVLSTSTLDKIKSVNDKMSDEQTDPIQSYKLSAGTIVGVAAVVVGDQPACDWHKHDDAMAAGELHL